MKRKIAYLILGTFIVPFLLFLVPLAQATSVFPAIRSTSSGTATLVSGTLGTYTFTLPTNHIQGDLLIIQIAGIATATQQVITFAGDFKTLYNLWTSASRIQLAAWTIDNGAYSTQGQFTSTIANTYRYIVYAITVNTWYAGSPPEVGTAITGTSTGPDPPAITPSWGSASDLFIASGIWTSTATRTSCPTNYATPTDVTGTSPGMSSCIRTLAGTTDNPAAFLISASSAWTAQTIAIRGGPDISVRWTSTMSVKTVTFTSTVTGAIGAVNYSWTFGDGGISYVANPAHTYVNGGNYQVALTVTDTLFQYTAWGTVIIGYPTLLVSVAEAAGANCANAGFKITYGLDNGAGGGTALDGILQAGEVTNTIYVCNGAVGATGSTGAAGFNSLVSTTTASEPAGANCANGGTKVTFNSGLDNGDGGGTARDGILQSGEIDATTIFYSCTGNTGSTGSIGPHGHDSLIVTDSTVGTNCNSFAGTGTRVRVGVDTNDNGILDSGEVQFTSYLCNGATGATGPTGNTGAAGHNSLIVTDSTVGTNCNSFAGTGTRVRVGVDTNDNGILDAGEIQYTSYICNGATGSAGTNGTNGTNGHNALVKLTAISLDSNCPATSNGETKVESGVDTNDNGVLDAGEVQFTKYVCGGLAGATGATGSTGASGHNALITTTPISPINGNCPATSNGETRVDSGVDTNNNGILDAGEITSTVYVCGGLLGIQGPVGPTGSRGPTGPQGPAGQDARAWILFSMIASLSFLAIAVAFAPRIGRQH